MKIIPLCFLIFLISCSQNVSENSNISPTPVFKPTITDLERANRTESLGKDKQELEKFIKDEARHFGFPVLANKNLDKGDLEVRVWRFAAFGDKNLIFILKRTNENWSANLLQKTIAKKDIAKNNPPEKYSTKQFKEPKSGWKNLWQKLTDAEILTLPTGSEVGNEPSPDSWAFIVETKVEGNYRVYEYQSPEHNETNEAQQMTKIISIISEEFNLDDFNENNFQQP